MGSFRIGIGPLVRALLAGATSRSYHSSLSPASSDKITEQRRNRLFVLSLRKITSIGEVVRVK